MGSGAEPDHGSVQHVCDVTLQDFVVWLCVSYTSKPLNEISNASSRLFQLFMSICKKAALFSKKRIFKMKRGDFSLLKSTLQKFLR